ncbi:uncharacterized protein LOC121640449 isoform X2 [Melanotaenia boesemani]|uniref:uncharacterized protein LOC121640449 isoform X2 n=1 Tax=Melanotaenia boesemani TaxID=1250792 RepID=UPI001C04ABE0|nr:uncharacterized protein LOC121640449 isoform X2 [Melanotaenia boesemani]
MQVHQTHPAVTCRLVGVATSGHSFQTDGSRHARWQRAGEGEGDGVQGEDYCNGGRISEAVQHQTKRHQPLYMCPGGITCGNKNLSNCCVWNLQPNISLLDADGKVVAVGTERTVGQRNLHLVKVGVKVDAAEGNLKGNGTIICRLEIPKAKLVEEKNICVTDDFIPSEDAGFQCHTLLFVIVALVCIIIVVFVPLWIIEELRFVMADFCIRKIAAWRAGEEGEQLLGDVNFTELGDLNNITTSGASETSAVINNLQQRNGTMVTGVEASNILAEQDLKAMSRYKGIIIQVGKKHHIYPSLIAAIISKQSRAGTILQLNGYGTFDNNCYGLMQINKAFYATSGSPYSLEHIEDGTKHLVHLIKTLKQSEESRNWSPVQHLKGALIAYISGIDKVRAGVATIANVDEALEKLDMETPTDDFANDVFARAKWFANYGY